MAKTPDKISKKEFLNPSIGHQQPFCGTGVHRDWKKEPKGGRRQSSQRAIRDSRGE